MQLNVKCMLSDEGWTPVWNEYEREDTEYAFKAYHVAPERIVYVNLRENIVRIDDGTADGICWTLGKTSARAVKRMLDGESNMEE